MQPFKVRDETVCCRELKPGVKREAHLLTDHLDYNEEEKVSDVRFIHPYVSDCKGRATVAWQSHPDHGDQISIGVAWCSPKDRFRRDKGRLIAEGRLKKKPLKCKVPLTERNGRQVIEEFSVLTSIINPETKAWIPRWADGKMLFIQEPARNDPLQKSTA